MRSAEAMRTKRMRDASKKTNLRVVDGRESTRRKRRVRPIRYLQAVNEETRKFDPMHHPEGLSRRVAVLCYIIGAAMLHAVVFYGLSRSPMDADRRLSPVTQPEKVTVRITEPKITPPKPVPAPEPEQIPAPEKTVVAPEKEPVAAAPRPVKTVRSRKATPSEPDVPVDPIDIPDQAPAPAEPRRRVVGINFESTIQGGNGPAFAVGNTRMGETGNLAEDAKDIDPLTGRPYRPGAKRALPTPNKVSTAIPTAGVTLTKPKRLSSVQPAYPALLKTQGIEGDVAVLIQIDTEGRVTSVKMVKGSGYPEFDEAATAAALKERFSPAVRNGEAIDYTLKYTYRFRVREQ